MAGLDKDALGPRQAGGQGSEAWPYDLRHSLESLLIQEGFSIIKIARQAGHTPTRTLEVYGHVFDKLDPTARVSAETQSGSPELVAVS